MTQISIGVKKGTSLSVSVTVKLGKPNRIYLCEWAEECGESKSRQNESSEERSNSSDRGKSMYPTLKGGRLPHGRQHGRK
jgi:hypothetical protein